MNTLKNLPSKLYRPLKTFGVGILMGLPLFIVATVAVGWFSGAYGLPVPQLYAAGLQESAGIHFPWEVSADE